MHRLNHSLVILTSDLICKRLLKSIWNHNCYLNPALYLHQDTLAPCPGVLADFSFELQRASSWLPPACLHLPTTIFPTRSSFSPQSLLNPRRSRVLGNNARIPFTSIPSSQDSEGRNPTAVFTLLLITVITQKQTQMCHYSPLSHEENLLCTTVPCMKLVWSISNRHFLL